MIKLLKTTIFAALIILLYIQIASAGIQILNVTSSEFEITYNSAPTGKLTFQYGEQGYEYETPTILVDKAGNYTAIVQEHLFTGTEYWVRARLDGKTISSIRFTYDGEKVQKNAIQPSQKAKTVDAKSKKEVRWKYRNPRKPELSDETQKIVTAGLILAGLFFITRKKKEKENEGK